MVNLPPPVWTVLYVLIAAGASYLAGWPRIPGLPLVPLGVLLIIAGVALAVAAARLFRREGTEINPTSLTNRKLVTFGPFNFTRNPMYLSLRDHRAGDRLLGRCLADVPRPDRAFRNGELGAYTVRGGEDAPPIRRGL